MLSLPLSYFSLQPTCLPFRTTLSHFENIQPCTCKILTLQFFANTFSSFYNSFLSYQKANKTLAARQHQDSARHTPARLAPKEGKD
jgi:hypothetical protein